MPRFMFRVSPTNHEIRGNQKMKRGEVKVINNQTMNKRIIEYLDSNSGESKVDLMPMKLPGHT